MTEEEKQNKYSACNTFAFVLGFIYYPVTSSDTSEDGGDSSGTDSGDVSTESVRRRFFALSQNAGRDGRPVVQSRLLPRPAGSISTSEFDDDSISELDNPFIELGRKFKSGKEINDASYEAAFMSSVFSLGSPPYDTVEAREKIFEFCNVKHGNCSMVAFTLIDLGFPDWSLSNFYYQLLGGACQDSVSLSDVAM
jgi:hypothetical protein